MDKSLELLKLENQSLKQEIDRLQKKLDAKPSSALEVIAANAVGEAKRSKRLLEETKRFYAEVDYLYRHGKEKPIGTKGGGMPVCTRVHSSSRSGGLPKCSIYLQLPYRHRVEMSFSVALDWVGDHFPDGIDLGSALLTARWRNVAFDENTFSKYRTLIFVDVPFDEENPYSVSFVNKCIRKGFVEL